MSVAVLIPVYRRPERVAPLIESLRSSERRNRLSLLFLVCRDDVLTLEQIGQTEAPVWLFGPPEPGYAVKMNMGVQLTEDAWVFFAADDLCFCPGWADEAIAEHERTGKRVIGTNDLGNPNVKRGSHSTHTLMHRSYADLGTFDDPSRVLHEGYHHNYVDNEFVETAKWRNEFASARESHVEHLHWAWHKSHDDETYRRGREHYALDGKRWQARERLLRETPRLGGALAPRMADD